MEMHSQLYPFVFFSPRCFGNGRAVGFRKLPAAVQQRPVNIQRNQSYSHRFLESTP
jgi:hypothetical protein